jgi:hypothetical protein
MKIKKRKKKDKLPEDVSGLASLYLNNSSDFGQMLQERSPGEVAFDNEVLRCLRRGLEIREALATGAAKYPDEGLQWTEETLPDITAHYEYLLNHEDIVRMLSDLTRRNR